jgi:hypothetical protein
VDNRSSRTNLPSKKVLVLASAVLAGFVVYGVVANYNAIRGFIGGVSNDNQEVSIASEKQTDTDEDGLTDWQERLWGTDIDDSDTDGDGTEDGKEVEQNRDPTVAGPNDSLDRGIEGDDDNQGTSTNITAEIGSEVLPRAVVLAAAEQSGEDISESDLNRISSSISEKTNVGNVNLTDSSELTVMREDNPQQYEQYFNQLNDTLQPINSGSGSHPIKVVARAQQQNNLEAVDLSPHILRHKKAIRGIKEISVPQQFLDFHIKSLHALERKLYSLENMNRIADDPVGAVMGIKQYRIAGEADIEAAKILNETLQSYANEQ